MDLVSNIFGLSIIFSFCFGLIGTVEMSVCFVWGGLVGWMWVWSLVHDDSMGDTSLRSPLLIPSDEL